METSDSLPVLSFFSLEKFKLNLETALFGEEEPVVLTSEDRELGIREDDIPYFKAMFGGDSVEIDNLRDMTPKRKNGFGREIYYRRKGDLSLVIFHDDSNVRRFIANLRNAFCSCLDIPTKVHIGDLVVETGVVYEDLLRISEEDVNLYEKVSLRLRQPLIRHDETVIPKGRVRLEKQNYGDYVKELVKRYSPSFFSGVSREDFERVLPSDWFLK